MSNRTSGPTLLGFGDFFSAPNPYDGADGYSGGINVGAVARASLPVRKGAVTVKPAPTKGEPPKKGMPKGKIKVVKAKGKGRPSPHKAAMANAAQAGQRALSASKGGFGKATIYKKNVKAGKHAPPVRLAAVGFRGDGTVVLGAVGVKKQLTPKQRAAVARHASAAARLSAAHKASAAAAAKAKAAGTAALAFVKKTVPLVRKALIVPVFGATKTAVGVAQLINAAGGVEALSDEEVLGASMLLGIADGISGTQTEIGAERLANEHVTPFEAIMLEPAYLGNTKIGGDGISGEQTEIGVDGLSGEQTEIGVDINGLSPGQPGYDATTDFDALGDPSLAPDPSLSSGSGLASADPGTGQVLAPDGTVLYDPATDPAVIPMPVRGQDLTQDELMEVWDHVPDDGFVYAESEGGKHYPANSVGSVNVFTGTNKNANGWAPGLIFGGEDWLGPSTDDPNTFWHSSWPSTVAIQKRSLDLGWGPLVGNPLGQLKNMQYAQVDKKWFWQGKSAPVAYSAEADAKIAQANQAIVAANRAAAVAQAKQMQADALAAQEAQTKQDAANALAESAAQSQMNVAAASQQVQQGQIDLDSQKQQQAMDTMQAQMAQQQAQVQAQAQAALIQQAGQQSGIQAQAQQQLLDQAAVWNQWAKAHPDEAVAQLTADESAAPPDDAMSLDGEDDGDYASVEDEGPTDDDLLSDSSEDDFADFPE